MDWRPIQAGVLCYKLFRVLTYNFKSCDMLPVHIIKNYRDGNRKAVRLRASQCSCIDHS